MRFEDAAAALEGIPHMPPAEGRLLYDFVRAAGVRDMLELGFAHGVSSCYAAAAMQENGGGRLVTIDTRAALERRPSIHDNLARTGLKAFVEPVFAETSYTWELMKRLEARTRGGRTDPEFDLVFVDGAHAWDPDGFAFFLAERLLRPGGWVLFDDLQWTYASSPTLRDQPWVKAMPEEQRTTPQVQKVFDLLVRTHPSFEDAEVRGNWGWARKKGGAPRPGLVGDVYAQRPFADRLKDAAQDVKRRLTG